MQLSKQLSFMDVFCIATGAMISSGLFVLPGVAHAQAGPAVALSYLLAGVFAAIGILNAAELTTAMPKAGGDYFFISRSMGPAMGAVSGMLSWFAMSLKSTFALIGMAAFVKLVYPIEPIQLVSVPLCMVFVLLNILGVKEASRLQFILVMGLLTLLGLYIFVGVPSMETENLRPFMPKGWTSVLATAGLVYVSYGGLLGISSVAEEVKNPARTIPWGMFTSLIVVVVLYVLVVLVTSGVLSDAVLDGSLTPVSDGATVFLGRPGRIALSLAAILAFVSTANAGIMAAARYPLALSRDGLLPQVLGRVSHRFKTPYVAILLTGAVMVAALFLELVVLVRAASTVLLLANLFAGASVIILRESKLKNYQPSFHAPLYPWIQIVAILGSAFLIFEMERVALLISALLVAAGFSAYWLYGRIRYKSEYALLHLIKRIVEKLQAKELVTGSLEDELKDILHERDDTHAKQFETLLRDSLVLDIDERLGLEEFFDRAAKALSSRVRATADELREALLKRERNGTTIIRPGLAIPHAFIEGSHEFQMLLARANKGVDFEEEDEDGDVAIIFILVGTTDERHFHLHALSEIAHAIQEPRFERWFLEAKDEKAMRAAVQKARRQS